ncbi:MAG: hypothetical protein EPO21_23030 [Chloroflexota bacterium]|nr:MAG: hypothetical protein EPO21_23030 [Chloroflexota bacterium]
MNEPRLFTVFRNFDASGVSGPGRVMDGVVFHTGQVVVCWRSDINPAGGGYSSICIYPSWDAFKHVHVDPHPENQTEIVFHDCDNTSG